MKLHNKPRPDEGWAGCRRQAAESECAGKRSLHWVFGGFVGISPGKKKGIAFLAEKTEDQKAQRSLRTWNTWGAVKAGKPGAFLHEVTSLMPWIMHFFRKMFIAGEIYQWRFLTFSLLYLLGCPFILTHKVENDKFILSSHIPWTSIPCERSKNCPLCIITLALLPPASATLKMSDLVGLDQGQAACFPPMTVGFTSP